MLLAVTIIIVIIIIGSSKAAGNGNRDDDQDENSDHDYAINIATLYSGRQSERNYDKVYTPAHIQCVTIQFVMIVIPDAPICPARLQLHTSRTVCACVLTYLGTTWEAHSYYLPSHLVPTQWLRQLSRHQARSTTYMRICNTTMCKWLTRANIFLSHGIYFISLAAAIDGHHLVRRAVILHENMACGMYGPWSRRWRTTERRRGGQRHKRVIKLEA